MRNLHFISLNNFVSAQGAYYGEYGTSEISGFGAKLLILNVELKSDSVMMMIIDDLL